MAHFAKIDENNIVEQVIVVHNDSAPNEKIGQEFIASIGLEGVWKQTSYNTIMGKHALGGTPFRKNYAVIGYTYDEQRDAFIPPRPETTIHPKVGKKNDWVLNEDTCWWESVILDL
jgi:hypothetical protein